MMTQSSRRGAPVRTAAGTTNEIKLSLRSHAELRDAARRSS